MLNYQILNWKKLKTSVKNKAGAALRMSLKMFNRNDLPNELLLTTRQKNPQEMYLITKCQLI